MIDINKAQTTITDEIDCSLLENNITRQGSYLAFDDVDIKNHANIDYNFSLFIAIGLMNRDKTKIYKELNDRLNEINGSSSCNLKSCRPFNRDGKLLIYELKLTVNIVG